MADTLVCLLWALERPCPLRTGKNWTDPREAEDQLSKIDTYLRMKEKGNIFDGICITGVWLSEDSAGGEMLIPCSGFKVSDLFAGRTPESVIAVCDGCSANSKLDEAGALGCYGLLYDPLVGEDLHKALKKAIKVEGLASRWETLFHQTNPIGYGFWIDSPLSKNQCECLLTLCDHPLVSEKIQSPEMSQFKRALALSIRHNLPLHVWLPALGHTDFGYSTVFAHCPKCKASGQLPPFGEPDPDKVVKCRVCGNTYKPHETYSSEMDHDKDNSLGDLNDDETDDFRRRYLLAKGFDADDIERTLAPPESLPDSVPPEWGFFERVWHVTSLLGCVALILSPIIGFIIFIFWRAYRDWKQYW